MTTPRQPITDPQAGISLVEVIMYSTLTVLVLTVVASLFYVGFQTQAVAGDRDTATGHAQVVANTLQSGVGNASAISVTGSTVQARVATGTTGWQCAAWALTSDHKLVYRTSDSSITDTDYSTWTVLATGVSGGLSGGDAFSGDATRLDYSFRFASGSVTVPIAGAATATAFGAGSPESCW
ncbi:MAG TPA: hypothetical protein DCM67_02230 [Propionibacteriaceae bacterium]|nr:hypothetical protein [Propionibacteriaceae bacterium]